MISTKTVHNIVNIMFVQKSPTFFCGVVAIIVMLKIKIKEGKNMSRY